MVFAIDRSIHALRLVEMTFERMLSRDDWRVFVMSRLVETSRSSDATYPSPARTSLGRMRFLDNTRNDMEGGIVISTTLGLWTLLLPSGRKKSRDLMRFA